MADDQPTPTEDDAWQGKRVERWVEMADRLDRQMAPISDLLFVAAALRPGERVLDVGCGTGPTTRRAAAAVGPTGDVTGLDIAADMLAAAGAAPSADDAATIRYEEADAATWTAPERFDVVLSRFGVMFFDDPAAAFANLARVTRPGGRLAVVVWDRRDRSEMFQVPLDAALATMAAAGVTAPAVPLVDGAFSLSDPAAVATLLEGSGWHDPHVERHDVRLLVGGGTDPAGAAEDASGVGPTRRATEGIDDDLRAEVRDAMAAAFARHLDAEGRVELGGRVFVVTAIR